MANRVRLDLGAVRAFLTDPVGPVARLIDNLTQKAAGVARDTVRVRTGETLRSIETDVQAGMQEKAIRIGEVHASYAVWFLEKGVKPHLIWSHGDWSLHGIVDDWVGKDDVYFGPVVLHPGFGPKPFLTTGLWSLQNEF